MWKNWGMAILRPSSISLNTPLLKPVEPDINASGHPEMRGGRRGRRGADIQVTDFVPTLEERAFQLSRSVRRRLN